MSLKCVEGEKHLKQQLCDIEDTALESKDIEVRMVDGHKSRSSTWLLCRVRCTRIVWLKFTHIPLEMVPTSKADMIWSKFLKLAGDIHWAIQTDIYLGSWLTKCDLKMTVYLTAAANDCFHYWEICWLFSKVILWSIKFQKKQKNAAIFVMYWNCKDHQQSYPVHFCWFD